MSKQVVAVLFGGQSSEHDVSKVSAATIISNINTEKYSVQYILQKKVNGYYTTVLWTALAITIGRNLQALAF